MALLTELHFPLETTRSCKRSSCPEEKSPMVSFPDPQTILKKWEERHIRPEYSGPALKVVLFDRSGHFGRSDRNVPFHLTKLLSPVPLFCILLARTITKRAVAWVGSVEPDCTVPLNTENFRNFKPEFLLNGKRPWSRIFRSDQTEMVRSI